MLSIAVDRSQTFWLLSLSSFEGSSVPPTLNRRSGRPVEVFALSSVVVHRANSSSRCFGVGVRLGLSELDLLDAFAYLCSLIVANLGELADLDSLRAFVSKFASLFDVGAQVDPLELKGLWGELALIRNALPSHNLVSMWHALPWHTFDFESKSLALEVKTSESEGWVFDFAGSQLTARPEDAYVVPVRVYSSNSGESVEDLVEAICASLPVEDQLTIHQQVAAVLHSDVLVAGTARYSFRDENLHAVPVRAIPQIGPDVPSGVTGLRFRSDLAGAMSQTRSISDVLRGE